METRTREYLAPNPDVAGDLSTDLLIIGSGIAGLTTALRAAEHFQVLIITKDTIDEGSTRYAQGGIAFAIGEGDSIEEHVEDTLVAGAGYCDREMTQMAVELGPEGYRELVALGAEFDRDGSGISLHREGGHSRPRVVHAGDRSGAEVEESLVARVRANRNITVLENCFMVDLITSPQQSCRGALVWRSGAFYNVTAAATVLASGGAGQLFSITTNPSVATGDGIAAACRAGARVVDMEFIQFHPTALYTHDNPRFLISEAVRGEGALLIDAHGERFMAGRHPLAELAPRDVVVRAMALRMINTQVDHMFLDLRPIPREKMEHGFPTIYDELKERGFDLHKEPIPIAFAAHYTIGGVAVDASGRTTLPGLYACGEVSCTGMHGANRLASNSLLEGLVFSRKINAHLETWLKAGKHAPVSIPQPDKELEIPEHLREVRSELTALMMRYAGVFRSAKRLGILAENLPDLISRAGKRQDNPAWFELRNMFLIARLLHDASLVRTESRGTHQRQEFAEQVPEWSERSIAFVDGGKMVVENHRIPQQTWPEGT